MVVRLIDWFSFGPFLLNSPFTVLVKDIQAIVSIPALVDLPFMAASFGANVTHWVLRHFVDEHVHWFWCVLPGGTNGR
jgi:hypothetical protein